MAQDWVEGLRSIYENAFSVDWETGLQKLNQRLGLSDGAELRTSFPGLPPTWFNGDVEGLAPGNWTLVISLNHQLAGDKQAPARSNFWDYCRTHNSDRWYARFFRPLVRLSAAALGEQVSDERKYATTKMVFVELLPYASEIFGLSDDQLAEISSDPGWKTAAEVATLLIEKAEPRLILVNGVAALNQFGLRYGQRLRNWEWRTYESPGRIKPKNLRHKQGWLRTKSGELPVIGFPFLRTRSGHNSYAEIAVLGARASEFIRRRS